MPESAPTEGPAWVRRGRTYLGPVLVPTLPTEVPFGFLGRLLGTSEPVVLSLEAHRIDDHEAVSMLERADRVARTELGSTPSHGGPADSELSLEVESAQELSRRVAAREEELWRAGISFHAVGPSSSTMERTRSALLRRLEVLGFRPRVPRFQAAPALATPVPAATERRPAGYWHTLSTDGLAAFFPFVDECVVEPDGVLLGLGLEDACPIFLDRFRHASHSWGIFGQTGSGKSFGAGLQLLRTRWMRPEVRIAIVDPLGEFGELARRLGGRVLALGGPDGDHLNPLDPNTTGGDAEEKAMHVGAILRALFPSLTDEEVAVLDTSVAELYRSPQAEPTFSTLIDRLEVEPGSPPRLLQLLRTFRDGSLRRLDRPSSIPADAPVIDLDLSRASEEHRSFHLAYALDWVYGLLQRNTGPKLLIVDEAHLLARHSPTATFLDRVVRHVRHFGAGVLILSQNPEDFLSTESGRSLLRNLRATLLLRLAEVSPATREFFHLTAAEVEWLPRARLPREAGYSEGLLRFGEAHLPLAVVASTPEVEFLSAAMTPPQGSELQPRKRAA